MMTAAPGDRPTFLLRLRAEPGVDAMRALRAGLKALLRQHGLKCVQVTEEAALAPAPSQDPGNRREPMTTKNTLGFVNFILTERPREGEAFSEYVKRGRSAFPLSRRDLDRLYPAVSMALDPSGELDEWATAFLDEATTTLVINPVPIGWIEDRGPADVCAFAMDGRLLGAFPTRDKARDALEANIQYTRTGEVVVAGDHVVDQRRWHRN